MKSLQEIQKEIDLIFEASETERKNKTEQKKSVITRRKKRIVFLRTCIAYLQSGATENFLLKEKERLENKISAIQLSFVADDIDPKYAIKKGDVIKNGELVRGNVSKNELELKNDYEELMGVDVIHEQLKMIDYLLN